MTAATVEDTPMSASRYTVETVANGLLVHREASDLGEDERLLVFDPARCALRAVDDPAEVTLSAEDLRRLAECACALAVQEHDVPPARSIVLMPAIFLERALSDQRQALANLTHVQARCTALKDENRALVQERDKAREARTALRELRVACDECGDEPAVVVAGGRRGYLFLCAAHDDEKTPGARVKLPALGTTPGV